MTELPVLIPSGYLVTTTSGAAVNVGDEIAKRQEVTEEAINLAEKLEASPRSVLKMLKKNPGDSVEVGDILAAKSGFFSSMQVQSKLSGTVIRFERDSGKLFIQPTISNVDENREIITSPVEGVVSNLTDICVTISTDKNVYPAIRGVGNTATAESYLLEGKGNDDLLYRLDADAIGKVVISEKVTKELLMKALGIGVAGLIVLEMGENEMKFYSDKEKSVPLVILEKEPFAKVKSSKAKQVFVNGSEKVVVLLR